MSSHSGKITYYYLILMFGLIVLFFSLLTAGDSFGQSELWFRNFQDYMADLLNPAWVVSTNDPYDVIKDEETKFLNYYGYVNADADRAYPPLAYWLFSMMYPLFSVTSGADMMFAHYIMLLGAVFYAILLFNNLKGNNTTRSLIILSFLLSGIFMYSWERGNIILHTAVCMGFFLFYYNSNNKFIRELALIALCIAVNMKITPVILGLLLLQKKRYGEIARCILYCGAMFFLPLVYFNGGIGEQILKLVHNLGLFGLAYYNRGYPEFSFVTDNYERFLCLNYWGYISILVSVFAIIAFFLQKTYWKKVALLLICIYTSSDVSALYIFMYFFIFITMFLSQKKYDKKDFVYMLLIVIMLNPLQIYFNGANISHDLILAAMMTMIIMLECECFLPLVDYLVSIKNKCRKRLRKSVMQHKTA